MVPRIAQEKEQIMVDTLSEHIVYSIKVEGLFGKYDEYVGITVVSNGDPRASLTKRWKAHINAAKKLKKKWNLSKAIREYGEYAFDLEILEVVKNKKTAHKLERQIIRERKPSLNTDTRAKQDDIEKIEYFVFETKEREKTAWLDENYDFVYDKVYAKVFPKYDALKLSNYYKKYNKNKWTLKRVFVK